MRSLCICGISLALSASVSAQQLSAPPKWEFAASAALSEARPEQHDGWDNWYFQGRYAASIGHYWTEHLKTEVEYARSGEGSTFSQKNHRVDGAVYSYGIETFHRLEQASLRMVWQFGDNAWVHPYVNGGFVVDRERQRVRVPEQYQFISGRTQPVPVPVPEFASGPSWEYRPGTTVGAGVKIYTSRDVFFNAGGAATWSQSAATLSMLAGFGVDF